ncbi:MAG: CapA family protein, partial [Lachnospiraceae bacterium]|nr:CapA family protein [Lachnospiraceae bacterium]
MRKLMVGLMGVLTGWLLFTILSLASDYKGLSSEDTKIDYSKNIHGQMQASSAIASKDLDGTDDASTVSSEGEDSDSIDGKVAGAEEENDTDSQDADAASDGSVDVADAGEGGEGSDASQAASGEDGSGADAGSGTDADSKAAATAGSKNSRRGGTTENSSPTTNNKRKNNRNNRSSSSANAEEASTSTDDGTGTGADAVGEGGVRTVHFTFSATGDNLIHSYLYEQARRRGKNGSYSFDRVYKGVKTFYKKTDLNFINQESLCTDTLAPSTYPCFSTPGNCARALYKINMRVFNISNNHTYDKGKKGLDATWDFWNNKMPKKTLMTGLYKSNRVYNIPIYRIKGVKVAFVSFTYGTNGITQPSGSDKKVIYMSDEKTIKKQIRVAKKKADVVCVSAHWGTEDSHTISPQQRSLAKKLTNWGANLIIGTHPHVVQNSQWIKLKNGKKAFCIYSLGNFANGQVKP